MLGLAMKAIKDCETCQVKHRKATFENSSLLWYSFGLVKRFIDVQLRIITDGEIGMKEAQAAIDQVSAFGDRDKCDSSECRKLFVEMVKDHEELSYLGYYQGASGIGDQSVVSQLLEDAISTEAKHKEVDLKLAGNQHSLFDKYGFALKRYDDKKNFVEKASELQRRSDELRNMDIDKTIAHNVKWENFLSAMGNRDIPRSDDFKNLIRAGVPHNLRQKIWNTSINYRVGKERASHGANYYNQCMEKSQIKFNPAAKQIELDLLRTLPDNRHYENFSSEGTRKLRRVLLAYTQHNPAVGYCQGLNRLAAIALLYLSEEDSFWCLIAIIEYIMPPDYYTDTMVMSQADQRVLKEIYAAKMPRLNAFLEQFEVDLSLFTFNWFLTVFVDNVPVETYLRIWDSFLYEGNKVLFRYAIAFFKHKEEEILSCTSSLEIHRYLRSLGENAVDVDSISQIAFEWLNPFSIKTITTKRQVHLAQVNKELDELETIRQEWKNTPKTRYNQEPFSDDDT